MTSSPPDAIAPPTAPSRRRTFWIVFAAAFLGVLAGFLVLMLTLLLLAFCFPSSVAVAPPVAAQHQVTQLRLNAVIGALNLYRVHTMTYPASAAGGLDLLLARPSDPNTAVVWAGPYLRSHAEFCDAWGQPFHYECPGTHNRDSYDLWSAGPTPDPDDDVRNW